MTSELSVTMEQRNGYLYVKAKGDYAFKSVQDVFSDAVKTAVDNGLPRILFDAHMVTGRISMLERYRMGTHIYTTIYNYGKSWKIGNPLSIGLMT